jgi:hypothetical protein
MMWTLFRLALRLTLVPAVLLAGTLLGMVAAGEYLLETRWRVAGLGIGPDLLIWAFVVWSGFPAGSRLFSREFRERHFLLLQGLPVSRWRCWLSLVLGALGSGLASLALVFLVRPPTFLLRAEGPLESGVAAPGLWMVAPPVCLYVFFFSAGACYGLLLGGTVLQPVGIFATLGLLGVLLAGLVHLHVFGGAEPLPGPRTALENGLAVLVLASLLYLFLSYRLYARGEFPVSRVRWRGVVAVLLAHTVLLAAVSGLAVARVRSAPFTNIVENVIVCALSPDGRLAVVLEVREGYPRFARVNVVDVLAARVRGRVEIDGFFVLGWAPDGESFAVGTSGSFLGLAGPEEALRAGGDSSVRWVSADGELLREVELEHPLGELLPARDRILAEVVAEEERVLVDLGAGPDAAPRKLATTELSGHWTVRGLAEGPEVAIWNPGGRRAGRVLRLGVPTEELRVIGQPRSPLDEEIRVLGSVAFAGDALEQELDRRLPPVPGGGLHQVHRIVWDYLEEPPWTYALVSRGRDQVADVFALAPGAEVWQTLAEGLPWIRERDHIPETTLSPCVSLSPSLRAVCFDGIVVSAEGGGVVRHFEVADLSTGSVREIAGELHDFQRVTSRVALARVGSVDAPENPVTLSRLDLTLYCVPWRIGLGVWSEAGRGVIYEDHENGNLLLWTAGSSERPKLWPLPD